MADGLTGAVDDVEFLFSLSTPTVGYRSSPRKGNDDSRRPSRTLALPETLTLTLALARPEPEAEPQPMPSP